MTCNALSLKLHQKYPDGSNPISRKITNFEPGLAVVGRFVTWTSHFCMKTTPLTSFLEEESRIARCSMSGALEMKIPEEFFTKRSLEKVTRMRNQPDPHSGFSWTSWSGSLLPEKRLIHTAGVAIEESLLAPLTRCLQISRHVKASPTKAQDLSVHPIGKLSQSLQKMNLLCFISSTGIVLSLHVLTWLYLPGSENSKDLCICFSRFMGKAVPNVILNEILQNSGKFHRRKALHGAFHQTTS